MKEPNWIYGELRKRGHTSGTVAALVGCSPRQVRNVIEGKHGHRRRVSKSLEVRREIARLLGRSFKAVWGAAEPEEAAA